MRYNPSKIEKKWQTRWLKEGTYEPDLRRARKPFYNLMMFPYPSAEGLHIGAMRTFSGVDIYGRLKRMQGHDVFEPIGLDGFGIHSENYALKVGKHPVRHAKDSEKNFYRQLGMMGNGFAWRERLETYDPNYYKWTQWIFVQMFKRGLAYRKKQAVNWCPSCMTVLADEQVVKKSKYKIQNTKLQSKIQNGQTEETRTLAVCERCDTPVIKKELEQWFFRITEYADRLLKNLEKLDWSERVKVAQREWIGKSEGALIKFSVIASDQKERSNLARLPRRSRTLAPRNDVEMIEVFTTRPDTLFGATYLVLGPEHPFIQNRESGIRNDGDVGKYIQAARVKSEEERIAEGREKTGMELKGIAAINPANGEEVPVWVADYVLGHVGTGAIMAVPAHDKRDWEFAERFTLPIRRVVFSRFNCVMIHGCPPDKKSLIDIRKETDQHWIPWLRNELSKRNVGVFSPLMPQAWHPDYDEWKKEIEKLPIDETSVLIGHSCGGAFLVRWLSETKRDIRKLILVAAAKITAPDVSAERKHWFDFSIDPLLKNRIKETVIFIGLKDKERHQESARIYAKALGGQIMEFPDKGHFMPADMGDTNVFPELLYEILHMKEAYTGRGVLMDSGRFNGMDSESAKQEIAQFVGGKRVTRYHLRDWLISRQRYWAPPIPMIFCESCAAAEKGERYDMPGWYAAPEETLPVKLPFIKNFRPTGTDQSPLAGVAAFYKVKCPGCNAWARRETDVSDTFLDSAWYYLRYPSVREKKHPWNPAITKKWLPVNRYIGGAEHSVLHLLYVRFLAMALHDAGLVHFDEPMPSFRAHGLITKDGAKMSKSKGNVVNPDEYVRAFGADAVRMYLAFMAPFEQGGDFRDSGIKGLTRFLERVWKFVSAKFKIQNSKLQFKIQNKKIKKSIHKTIKKVTEDIESLHYNTAISALMVLLNELEENAKIIKTEDMAVFLKLLAPFAPHITEELWQAFPSKSSKLKAKSFRSIHHEPWPEYDPWLVQEDAVTVVFQVNGRVRDQAVIARGSAKPVLEKAALASPKIQAWMKGQTPKKTVVVPDRLVNIVV